MRKCYCPKRARWFDDFVAELRDAIEKKLPGVSGRDIDEFSAIMTLILQEITANGWSEGPNGGRHCSPDLVSRNLGISRKTVIRHIKAAARCGILKGLTFYRLGAARRLPLEILINPGFGEAMSELRPMSRTKTLVYVFADMWAERVDYDEDVQGFQTICQWGKFEEDGVVVLGPKADPKDHEAHLEQRDWMARILEASKGVKVTDTKAAKAQENKQWADRGQAFVRGAANVWQVLQGRAGRGFDPPPWAGEFNKLSGPNKRAYRDLTKIFEQYGGRKTAFAWAVFCGGTAKRDENGKLDFLPEMAHKQWTTPDKRPEHFAKHLTLVLNELASLGWMETRQDMDEKLRGYFNDAFESPPRYAAWTTVAPEATGDASRNAQVS